MQDVRDVIFRGISEKQFRAVLTAERAGVLSGAQEAQRAAAELGIALELCKGEGENLGHGERIGNLLGTPKQIAMAEECIIGTLAKASGIATAARTAVQLADGGAKIVSGSWKKMPPAIKDMVRRAITTGGASFRIAQPPMLYLDKNFVRMLGGISAALEVCKPLPEHTRVVQLRGQAVTVEQETDQAVLGGAKILMVDTGRTEDLDCCVARLKVLGARERVEVAFAGNVKLTDIPTLILHGADILCIGKEIVDAGLLDLKLDVLGEEG